MAAFELSRGYPLAQILAESVGSWIVEGLIKELSPSEAIILLRPTSQNDVKIDFLSAEECLVHFYRNTSSAEKQTLYQRLGNLKALWVFVVKENVGTPIRVVSRPISFQLNPSGRFTLSIPMTPPLSPDEWHWLGVGHIATATLNESDSRLIRSESDIEELCQSLRGLPSFCVHAIRFEGDMLDVSVDSHGALVNYLDLKRSVKKTSINPDSREKRLVRMKIDALPNLDLEVERRHLIPLEKGLDLLRSFLIKGEPVEMVRWPLDD